MTGRTSRLVAIALLGIVGGIAWFTLPGGDERPSRDGSEVVDGNVDIASRTVEAFAITYREDVFTEEGTTSMTERVLVRRPFDAVVSSEAGANVSRLGRFAIGDTALAVPPGIPDADLRPSHVLPEAIEHGAAERREVREVVGRRCRVFRTGDAIEPGVIVSIEDADSVTDVCVDGAGLVLESVILEDDEIVRRRVATEVDTTPAVSDEDFDAPEPRGDPRQVGSVQDLRDDSRLPGEEFWQLSSAPARFELEGRFAVVPPGQPGFSDVAVSGQVVTFLSEVWTDGIDVIVIEQGATRGAKPFEPDPQAIAVPRAGDLTDGELRLSLRMSEVRFLTGGVRFVRVRGTVPPSRLVEIAGELEATEGGPLQLAER